MSSGLWQIRVIFQRHRHGSLHVCRSRQSVRRSDTPGVTSARMTHMTRGVPPDRIPGSSPLRRPCTARQRGEPRRLLWQRAAGRRAVAVADRDERAERAMGAVAAPSIMVTTAITARRRPTRTANHNVGSAGPTQARYASTTPRPRRTLPEPSCRAATPSHSAHRPTHHRGRPRPPTQALPHSQSLRTDHRQESPRRKRSGR